MYLSNRVAIIKNFSTAIVNGAITLTLLLIAPLGLAAVIGNTFLVTVACFFVGNFSDIVVNWLRLSSADKNQRFTAFQIEKELQKIKKASAIEKKQG